MLNRLGTLALVAAVVVVILVVAAIPLFLVYRSSCREGGETVTRYDVVLPWNEPPSGCADSERGIDIVADELSL